MGVLVTVIALHFDYSLVWAQWCGQCLGRPAGGQQLFWMRKSFAGPESLAISGFTGFLIAKYHRYVRSWSDQAFKIICTVPYLTD